MNYVKEIRLELGLTQAALADILCTSRANISLVEADIRKLSSDNLVKLRKLKMHSVQIPAEEMDGMEELVQKRKMELKRHLEMQIQQTEAKLTKAEKSLEIMTRKFTASCEALKLIRKELEIFAGVEDYEKRLNEQFNIQKKIYLDNHPSAWYLHELNISEFKSTLELYRQQLAQQFVQ